MCDWIQYAAQGGKMALDNKSKMDDLQSNIAIVEQQRRDTLNRGNTAMENQYVKNRQVQGEQSAQMGASGFDANSGSSAQVQADTVASGEQDAQTIRSNALKEAWGYQVQIDSMQNQLDAINTDQTLLTGGLGTLKGRKFLGAALSTGGMSAPFMTSSKVPGSSKASIL